MQRPDPFLDKHVELITAEILKLNTKSWHDIVKRVGVNYMLVMENLLSFFFPKKNILH